MAVYVAWCGFGLGGCLWFVCFEFGLVGYCCGVGFCCWVLQMDLWALIVLVLWFLYAYCPTCLFYGVDLLY